MALKKASKRILISDESLNSFSFRILTDGINLVQYNKNPLFLWMHFRPSKGTRDEILPLGIVSDLKIENNAITGVPEFDDTDEFAMRLYSKFEAGIIRMCSPGLHPVEFSRDKKLMLPNQTLPTLTKSILKEVSLADIGSNDNALAYADVVLYDENEKAIELNEDSIFKLSQKLIVNGSSNFNSVNLTDIATALGIDNISNVNDVRQAIIKLKNDKASAELKLSNVELKLSNALNRVKSQQIESLISDALFDNKILISQKDHYTALANLDFESTKGVLDNLPSKAYKNSNGETDRSINDKELKELMSLSGEELWKRGKFERLKELSASQYKLRFREFFKKEPAE